MNRAIRNPKCGVIEKLSAAPSLFLALAVALLVWACHDGPTRPSAPSNELASSGALNKPGNGNGGGGGGKDDPALYTASGTGAFEFSGTMEMGLDNKRKVEMGGLGITLKMQFSDATVNSENCHLPGDFAWDDPEIVALRESLTAYEEVADIIFTYFRQTGRGWISRRNGPWTMYCVEEDGSSGGCDATETIQGDGTHVFTWSGSTTTPTRWVKAVGGPASGNEVAPSIICMDQEGAPGVTVTAVPAP